MDGTKEARMTRWQRIVHLRRVLVLALLASFSGLLVGIDLGILSGLFAIKAFQNAFHLRPGTHEFSVKTGNIAAAVFAGAIPGAASSYWISERWGRRGGVLIGLSISLVGITLQTVSGVHSSSLMTLYVGRGISGWGVTVALVCLPALLAEHADKRHRGRLTAVTQVSVASGLALATITNWICGSVFDAEDNKTWRLPFGLQLLPAVLAIAGLSFQYETPRWLIQKGRNAEGLQSLSFMRNLPDSDPSVQAEFQEILDDIRGETQETFKDQVKNIFSSKELLYRYIVVVAVSVAQQSSASNVVNSFGSSLFKSFGLRRQEDQLMAMAMYGIAKVIFTVAWLFLSIESLGRKYSLTLGALISSMAMVVMSAQLKRADYAEKAHAHDPIRPLNVAAIASLYIWNLGYSLGYGPIMWVVVNETATNKTRAFMTASAVTINQGIALTVVKTWPLLRDAWHWGAAAFYAGMCLLAAIIAAVLVPELAGVPLERSSELFKGGFRDMLVGSLMDNIPSRQRARIFRKQLAKEDASRNAGITLTDGENSTETVTEKTLYESINEH
ncbi:hypothetical protein PYCC9005_002691 [Savitreella phatthalungensis]